MIFELFVEILSETHSQIFGKNLRPIIIQVDLP